MAYKIMTRLIENYQDGQCSFTKEKLADMCDVYYGAGRLTDEQYAELAAKISKLE